MSKIQTQNPGSSEIQSSLIAGITEGLSKISGVLDLRVAELKDVKLNAISIDEEPNNKNRIYEAQDGNRLWLSSPAPVFKKNGIVITPSKNNFSVDYIGGSITFDKGYMPSDSDTITVSCQHITDGSNTISDMLADIQSNRAQANKYKGSYANPESLAQTVPSAKNGDFAVVLTPPAMFVWVTSEWKDARSVEDLKNYYNKTEIDSKLKEKENAIVAKGSDASADDFYFSGRKTWLSASEKVKSTELKGLVTSSKDPVSASDTVLSAIGKLQGQATEASESHFIKGSGAPTTSTKGSVGQRYTNTSNGDWYTCTSVSGNTYTWQKGVNDKKVSDHIADKSNPHNVTAAQVGAYSKSETYSQEQVNSKVSDAETKTDNHVLNKNNPHEVTAEQVGALSEKEYKGSAPGTVKAADNGVSVYTHNRVGSVNKFIGNGANGSVKLTANIQAGDTVQVNGVTVPAYAGADDFVEAFADQELTGRWLTFVFDGTALNFKPAGGGKKALIVTCTGSDGGSISGVTVQIWNRQTGRMEDFANYTGTAVVFELPKNLEYEIKIAGSAQGYISPDSKTGRLTESQSVELEFTKVYRYGFRRKRAEADPYTRIEYIFDAAGKTPMYVDTANTNRPVFGSGDTWQQFCYDIATPVMLNYDGTEAYELDRDDQQLKAEGGPSDVSNTAFPGNAMVRFAGFPWVHRSRDETYDYVVFSDIQYDETYHACAHTNEKGQIAPAFYWGMCKGIYSGGKLRSIAGPSPMVEQTQQTFVTKAQENGPGYDTNYKSGWDYINDLLTLISKNDNGQQIFGNGRISASSAISTGSLKAKPAFWGSNGGGYDVKVFFIEGFWGNLWEGMRGLINDNSRIKTQMMPPYNFDGTGYHDTGVVLDGYGYVSDAQVSDEDGWVPQTLSGSASTYYCDEANISRGGIFYPRISGRWDTSNRVGPRCMNIYRPASDWFKDVGSRLTYIPPEVK